MKVTDLPLNIQSTSVSTISFAGLTEARIAAGDRFAALLALPLGEQIRLLSVTSCFGGFNVIECDLETAEPTYPSFDAATPMANWYARRIFDLYGLAPSDAATLDPLIARRPCQGLHQSPEKTGLTPKFAESSRPSVIGEGVFKIPLGPVRSGVFESIEFVVETPGEEILHVEPRPFYKHRGVDAAFFGKSAEDGALIAERVEGIAGVAHAIAYCQAVEKLADVEIHMQAELVRVVHAELERIANHLESVIRHCEASAQAVAYARLSIHKESVMRLRSNICGHRFSRGVIAPGGVTTPLLLPPAEVAKKVAEIEKSIDRDMTLLMRTPSFLDRLRGTGVVTPLQARLFGALGPLGRGSGLTEDGRISHTYGAYKHLGFLPTADAQDGDAMSRQMIRIDEIANSFHLLRQALDDLNNMEHPSQNWKVELEVKDGMSLGWAEAPQGEVLYAVAIEKGRIKSLAQRSASFHNLALFSTAFPKDITTDFAFIEASFGISVAGASS